MAGITVKVEGREGVVSRVWGWDPDYGGAPEHYKLQAWVEFDPPLKGWRSVAVLIPARKYTRDEFIKEVEQALVAWCQIDRELEEIRRLGVQKRTTLKALVRDVAADLGLEGPTGGA